MKEFQENVMAELTRKSTADIAYNLLRKSIENGELKPGEALARATELRIRLGVSFHAVLKALELLERDGMVVRKRGSGVYVRDRSLVGVPAPARRHNRIITLATQVGVQASSFFLLPLENAIRAEVMLWGGLLREKRIDMSCVVAVPSQNVEPPAGNAGDTIIWVCQSAPPCIELPKQCSYILVAQDFESTISSNAGFDIVVPDSRQGGAMAGRYFRENGCRSVMFIGRWNPEENEWDLRSRLRLEGFIAGWGEKLPPEKLIRAEAYSVVEGLNAGDKIIQHGQHPCGIFAASDDLAMGLCHLAMARGIKVGNELKLIGFDGQQGRFTGDPMLTTISIPLEEMGKVAARWGLERVEKPLRPARRICLSCSIKKGSTA